MDGFRLTGQYPAFYSLASMSTSSESHRLGPVLRALSVVAGLISGACAFLFLWVVAAPDGDVRWAARLGGVWLAAGFSWATWAFAVSAVRGRSPNAIPVCAPWRTVAADLRGGLPILAAFAAFKILQARLGGWPAFAVAVALVLAVGQWRHMRRTAKRGQRDGPLD